MQEASGCGGNDCSKCEWYALGQPEFNDFRRLLPSTTCEAKKFKYPNSTQTACGALMTDNNYSPCFIIKGGLEASPFSPCPNCGTAKSCTACTSTDTSTWCSYCSIMGLTGTCQDKLGNAGPCGGRWIDHGATAQCPDECFSKTNCASCVSESGCSWAYKKASIYPTRTRCVQSARLPADWDTAVDSSTAGMCSVNGGKGDCDNALTCGACTADASCTWCAATSKCASTSSATTTACAAAEQFTSNMNPSCPKRCPTINDQIGECTGSGTCNRRTGTCTCRTTPAGISSMACGESCEYPCSAAGTDSSKACSGYLCPCKVRLAKLIVFLL